MRERVDGRVVRVALGVLVLGLVAIACSQAPTIQTNAAATTDSGKPSLAPTPQPRTVTDTATKTVTQKVMVTRTLPGGEVTSYATVVDTHTLPGQTTTDTTTATKTNTATQTQTKTQTQTATQTTTATVTDTATETATQTVTETVTETVTQTVTASPSA